MSYVIYWKSENTDFLEPSELKKILKSKNVFQMSFDVEANGHDYVYNIYYDAFRGVYIAEYSTDGEEAEVFEYAISELSDLIASYTNEFYNKILL